MKNKQKISSDKFTMMTQMPVNKLICKMAVPTIITMLVSAVYNMADTYFVGKIGTSATGAVGVVFSFMAIIQACGFFFGHGSGNYMSRKLGEQKTEEASVMASTGFFSSFAVGVIIGVLGLIFISPLSKLLGSTDTILPYTKQYLFYILCGTPFMMSSLVLNNQLRFQGSAVNGMIGVTAGGVLNILLDPIFIFVFKMGVGGADCATMLSQAIGFVCFDNSASLGELARFYGVRSTLWYFPFAYMSFHIKIIVTFPLVLLMCSAPFADANNLFIITRAGRTKWICGQLIYITLASAIYYLFIFACSVVTAMPYAEFSNEWGGLLPTIAYNNQITSNIVRNNFIVVSGRVLRCFTPLSACWFTFLLSWLNGTMLGLIICACNVALHRKYIGCGIAGFLIVLSGFFEQEGMGWYRYIRFSPVSWTTLDRVDVGGMTEYPSFYYCIAVYIALIVILSAFIIVHIRKSSLEKEVF